MHPMLSISYEYFRINWEKCYKILAEHWTSCDIFSAVKSKGIREGLFAPSVIFCTRTSSALITTRTEVSPRLHRALFTSWYGRPPSPGLPPGGRR